MGSLECSESTHLDLPKTHLFVGPRNKCQPQDINLMYFKIQCVPNKTQSFLQTAAAFSQWMVLPFILLSKWEVYYIQLIPGPLILHLLWLWIPSTYSFLIVPIKSLPPGTLITVCPNEFQITILWLKLQSLKLATRSFLVSLYLPPLSVPVQVYPIPPLHTLCRSLHW